VRPFSASAVTAVTALAAFGLPGSAAHGGAGAFPGRNGALAFVSERSSSLSVWTAAPGERPRRLTGLRYLDRHPRWSPDGRKLAYVATGAELANAAEIFTVAVPGGATRRLTRNKLVDDDPAWSPDGAELVFVSGAGRARDLFAMSANGANRRRLLRTCAQSPAWSPNGTTIVYAGCSGSPPRLYTVRPDGSGRRSLPVRGYDPAWSPDGRQLAFRVGTDWRLADADGSGERTVVTGADGPGGTAWSPDGTAIAFLRFEPNACSPTPVRRLYTAAPDGTNQRAVFPADCQGGYSPDWQPLCTAYGSAGPDRLEGTPGPDVLCGLGGRDVISAGAGDDVVIAGDGADRVDGGPGADRLFGAAGSDDLDAADGELDVVDGGPGRDRARADGSDLVASATRGG
jgi:Tol biopolymer transport system component